MKTKLHFILISAALVSVVPSLLSAAPASSPVTTPGSTTALTPAQRLQQLDDQLDSVFADTFRGFGDWFDDSDFASSIDLREQKDKYVVRVYVPGSDSSQVSARVDGRVLHVTASGEQKNAGNSERERYEQIVTLPGPVDAAKMHVDRKAHLVVISLPKTNTGSTAPAVTNKTRPPAASNESDFDQSIVDQMSQMQGRMDQILRDAFPGDSLTSKGLHPYLGSAMNLEQKGNNYVVRFYLPNQDLQNVQVKLNQNELRLTASQSKNEQSQQTESSSSEHYEQVMTLPGPVQEKGMKVERNGGTIVVTVPKKV